MATKEFEVIEEDDEFEEFETEDWGPEEEEVAGARHWQDDWDDEDTNDNFSQQLRAELEKTKDDAGKDAMKQ